MQMEKKIKKMQEFFEGREVKVTGWSEDTTKEMVMEIENNKQTISFKDSNSQIFLLVSKKALDRIDILEHLREGKKASILIYDDGTTVYVQTIK
jgi:hypothetical protein